MLIALKKRLYLFGASYFMFWSKLSLRRWNPRVIVVTGSVGKTTLLHILEAQFGSRARLSHHANSAYGLAFDVVGLRGITGSRLKWLYLTLAVPLKSLYFRHHQEFYVAEVDADRPHEAEKIGKWLKPEVVLWVSSEHSHAINYPIRPGVDVRQQIAEEYAKLAHLASKLIIYDQDNSFMQGLLSDSNVTLSGVKKTDVQNYKVTSRNSSFKIAGQIYEFAQPMPESTALQLLMALKLLSYLNIQPVQDLKNLTMPPGRSNYFDGVNGLQIIDSSYNAHNASVQTMVDMLSKINHKPKWLVLGDVIDQGVFEAEEHMQLAEYLSHQKLDKIILIGRRTHNYVLPVLKKSGIASESFRWPKEALEYLKKNLTGKEVVLFKGSQFLEGIIKHLLANPADEQYLCRREPAAQKQRQHYGVG